MANSTAPLIPVGIDLGSLHARVAIGDHIELSNFTRVKKSSLPVPNIISNAQGSRFTVALTTSEEQVTEESTTAKSSFIFGEAARRHLSRNKKPIDEFLVRYLCSNPEIEKNSDDYFQASSAFFGHLGELACHASTSASVQPSQLRIVLSMPPDASEKMKENVIKALDNGMRELVREKEGKKMEKKMADGIIVGVISDSAAACLAYGLLDRANYNVTSNVFSINEPPKDKPYISSNTLVIDWGASGLTLTHLLKSKTHLKTQKITTEPNCAGTHIISALLTHCASLLERKHSSMISCGSVLKHSRAVVKLTAACEIAVKTLARTNVAQIAVDGVYEGLDLNCSLSKPRFEMLCGKVLRLAEKTLTEFSNGTEADFDAVIICGNVCQMPAAEALIRKIFTGDVVLRTNKTLGGALKMDVDESIAIGCAMCAQDFLVDEQEKVNSQILNMESLSISSFEEKKEMEIEVPLCPVGIGIKSSSSKNNTLHTFIDVGSPLPAYVSRVIKLDEIEDKSVISIIQIDPNTSSTKMIAEISGISQESNEIELTLELSEHGKLSMAVNGGETIVV